LHGRFGAAVRAGDTDATGPVVASVEVAIGDDKGREPWEWSEPYSPASFEELLRRIGGLPDFAGVEAWTPNERGMRTAGPGFEVAMIVKDGYINLFSTIDDEVGDRAILAAVREVAEVGAPGGGFWPPRPGTSTARSRPIACSRCSRRCFPRAGLR